MEFRCSKIKYDGSRVRVEYDIQREDGKDPDEYTLFSADKPLRTFDAALQALTVDVIDICELATGDAAHITVRGVSLSYTNGVMGVSITALKALTKANAPLVLNTPHLPEAPYGEGAGGPLLDPKAVVRVQALIAEAQRYVDGEREQPSLIRDHEDIGPEPAVMFQFDRDTNTLRVSETTRAGERDELYDEAARLIVASGAVSISYLQRKLRIGFSRAARLVDQMQAEGLVSAPAGDGVVPIGRTVLVGRDHFTPVDREVDGEDARS